MPKIDFFDELAQPFQRAGCGNNYEVFDSIKDRYGVYIFQDPSNRDNEILYVGEAYDQNLKRRITQNYTEGDNSGGFRKNWCKMNEQDFDAFKTALGDWRIITISVSCNSRSLCNWIHALEAVLIGFLRPRYNKS